MNHIAIKTSDIDELFSEDDPYDGFSKYEQISRGRMRFNVPPPVRPMNNNNNYLNTKKIETNRNFTPSPKHAYPPPTPSSSPPRPIYSKFNRRESDYDDGNSADNEKSIHLYSSHSSPLRPPLPPPPRSPFHHPPPSHSHSLRERKENEEEDLIDLLAAAPPNMFTTRNSNTFFTETNEIDSLDDLKNISLVLHEKYIPPNLQQEMDPAIDDIINFKGYIPPPSIEKKLTDDSIHSSFTIPSPVSSPFSRRSYSSPTPKTITTPILHATNKFDQVNFSDSFASSSEYLDNEELARESIISRSSVSGNGIKAKRGQGQGNSPKKLRFTSDPNPTLGELSQLDDEYIKFKKRELEKMQQDLLDFSYLLEERDKEIRKRESEVQQRYQELRSAENEERERDDEFSYLRENDKRIRDEIKQLRAKNSELHRQVNNLHVSNSELTQKLSTSDSRLKNFKDALSSTKDKNVELQKQNDNLQLRAKKNEPPHSPAPRAQVEPASVHLVHETFVALVYSICSISESQQRGMKLEKLTLPSQLSVSLLGKLLPYVASRRDQTFQAMYLHLLLIVLNQESSGTSNKFARLLPDLSPFEQSQDGETLFFANMIALVISFNSPSLSDVTARALVALQGCVASEEGKEQFMKTDPMNTLIPLMRSKNRAVLIPIITLMLSMCSEGVFLTEFLRRCSNEEWFMAAAVALRSDITDVVDHLCVILEKLSKISSNRGIFTRTGIRSILSAILLKNHGQFTRMNIVSTLKAIERDE